MICVAIPHTGSIDAKLVEWLLKTTPQVLLQKTYSVCKGRNILTKRFLTETTSEWLCYLDSDMYPVDDSVFNFVEAQDESKQILFVPGITNKLRWNFSQADDGELLRIDEYRPQKKYELRPIKTFGGSGIFLRRSLVQSLPPNIWREAADTRTSEDILFSYTLTQTYKIPAYVVWGSALRHMKGGFDMCSVVGI
jgi:hypothetical protein